jgi:hypothetical protein
MTSRKKKRDESTDYLPFLKEAVPEISSEVALEWCERMADGFHKLTAETNARRDLMVALLHEPERRRRQVMAGLMADEPSPSPETH